MGTRANTLNIYEDNLPGGLLASPYLYNIHVLCATLFRKFHKTQPRRNWSTAESKELLLSYLLIVFL